MSGKIEPEMIFLSYCPYVGDNLECNLFGAFATRWKRWHLQSRTIQIQRHSFPMGLWAHEDLYYTHAPHFRLLYLLCQVTCEKHNKTKRDMFSKRMSYQIPLL